MGKYRAFRRGSSRLLALAVLTVFVTAYNNCSGGFSSDHLSSSRLPDDDNGPGGNPADDQGPYVPTPPGDLGAQEFFAVVEVTDGSDRYEFRQSAGTRLSDYVTGNFTQANIRVRSTDFSQFPMTIYFRPDVNSARVEMVVEWGRIFDGANDVVRNLGAYRLTLFRGSAQILSQDITTHYWLSRWRYQSAARPVIRDRAQLMANLDVLPLNPTAFNGMPNRNSASTYSPMGFAGFYADMGATGERDELGVITEPQAEYLNTGHALPFQTMMAQAEAINTFKIIMRETGTGIPLNFENHPTAHWYDSPQGSSEWVKIVGGYDNRYELAHHPAASYIPFMLTNDPYYLESVQFQAVQACGMSVPGYRGNGDCLMPEGQTRAYAWTLRDILYAIRATPTNANPDWFLPRSYYQKILDNNRVRFTDRFVNATASSLPFAHYFNSATRVATDYAMWQEEFVATVFGMAVLMGHENWRPLFNWKIQSTLARTNGTSGWVRACSTPYYIRLDGHTTWAQAWDANKGSAESSCTYTDPNRIPSFGSYNLYTHGTLAVAKRLGTPGAAASYDWYQSEAKRVGTWAYHKWSMAP